MTSVTYAKDPFREDLDHWEGVLGRELPSGSFGENLTTEGIDVNGALIGERWVVGEGLELQITDPRVPCSTFRGWIAERGWLRTFTEVAIPGTYLRVVTPGNVTAMMGSRSRTGRTTR